MFDVANPAVFPGYMHLAEPVPQPLLPFSLPDQYYGQDLSGLNPDFALGKHLSSGSTRLQAHTCENLQSKEICRSNLFEAENKVAALKKLRRLPDSRHRLQGKMVAFSRR